MASKKKKITLTQLLAEKDKWSYCYCSEKYQYYIDNKYTSIVKIKKSIVINYLNNLDKKTIIPIKNVVAMVLHNDL